MNITCNLNKGDKDIKISSSIDIDDSTYIILEHENKCLYAKLDDLKLDDLKLDHKDEIKGSVDFVYHGYCDQFTEKEIQLVYKKLWEQLMKKLDLVSEKTRYDEEKKENNEYKYSIEIKYEYAYGRYEILVDSYINDKEINCYKKEYTNEQQDLNKKVNDYLFFQMNHFDNYIILKQGLYSIEWKIDWSNEKKNEEIKKLCLEAIYPEFHDKLIEVTNDPEIEL